MSDFIVIFQMPPKRGLRLSNAKRSTFKRQKRYHTSKTVWDIPLVNENCGSSTYTADEGLFIHLNAPIEVPEKIPYQQPSHVEMLTAECEHASDVEVQSSTAQYEHTPHVEVAQSAKAGINKQSQTDNSVLYNDPEHNQYKIMEEWLEEAGEQDLIGNLKTAITSGKLQKNNICFKLFCEFIRNLCSTRVLYKPETLLWWVTGLKMYGSGWLRLMKGTQEKPNFSVPCQTTLRSLCPRAIRLQGPRRPGLSHIPKIKQYKDCKILSGFSEAISNDKDTFGPFNKVYAHLLLK